MYQTACPSKETWQTDQIKLGRVSRRWEGELPTSGYSALGRNNDLQGTCFGLKSNKKNSSLFCNQLEGAFHLIEEKIILVTLCSYIFVPTAYFANTFFNSLTDISIPTIWKEYDDLVCSKWHATLSPRLYFIQGHVWRNPLGQTSRSREKMSH